VVTAPSILAASLCILLLHAVLALVAMLRSPVAFLRYHVVLAAVYASGLLDLFESARLTMFAGEMKLTGGLWLISGAIMAVFFVLRAEELMDSRSFLIRHYRRFIILAIAIHVVFGKPAFSSALHFLELVYPFLILVLCHGFVRSGEAKEQLVRSFLWYAILLCCLVPVNFLVFGSNEINVLRYARVMSASLLPGFCVVLAVGLRHRRRWLLAAYGLMLIPLITISRGVTLAIALSLLVYTVGAGFRIRGASRMALMGFGACVLAGGILVTSQFRQRSVIEGEGDLLDATLVNTSGRLHIWSYFYEKLSDAPAVTLLFGEGFGASDDFARESDPGQWFKQPHNEYLRFTFNFGLVGLVAYFSMFVRFLVRVRTVPGEDPTRAALIDASRLLLVSVAVLAVFENFILYNPFGFTQNACVLLALAMHRETPEAGRVQGVGSESSIP
jgi:O-antigen ligase